MNSHFSFSRSPASGFPHLPQGQRESEFRDLWLPRSERILDTIVATGSSIVCLQECWLSHPEWVRLFDSSLGAAGYRTLKLPRTNNRGDGESEGTSTKPGNPDFDGLVDRVPAGLLAVVSRAEWVLPRSAPAKPALPFRPFVSRSHDSRLMIAVKQDQWYVVDYQQLLFHDRGPGDLPCPCSFASAEPTPPSPLSRSHDSGLMIAVKQDQWHVVDYQQLLFHDCGAGSVLSLAFPSAGPAPFSPSPGLMIAVKSDQWHVVDYQQLLFHDCGDRVAQIVRLRSKGRLGGRAGREGSDGAEGEEEDVLVVNTHLLFPHDANSNIIRLCQVATATARASAEEEHEEDVVVVNTHLLFPHDANSNIIRLCQVGFDQVGFDQVGFDQVGFDQVGFDQVGFDQVGFDQVGFDQVGFYQRGRAPGWAARAAAAKKEEKYARRNAWVGFHALAVETYGYPSPGVMAYLRQCAELAAKLRFNAAPTSYEAAKLLTEYLQRWSVCLQRAQANALCTKTNEALAADELGFRGPIIPLSEGQLHQLIEAPFDQ
ncbi:unnamed protein product [Closterium sp. NIES-53]